MEIYEDSIKIKKNFLKINIKNILCSFGEKAKDKFKDIIFHNLNDDSGIKYIIKIISYYTKTSTNNELKNKCFELFLILIKNLREDNIITNLTSLLLFMQEFMNIFKIYISFDSILDKLNEIEIKTFEILNGFCIVNIKKDEKIAQKEALLCYQNLIKNFKKLINNEIKEKVINSFLDTMISIILNKKDLFDDKYLLLIIVNDIILLSKERSQNYSEKILSSIIGDLSINDNNIKLIILNIINNIIKFSPNKRKENKNIIYPTLIELNNNKENNNMIKRIIYDINNSMESPIKFKSQIIKVKKGNINRSYNKNNQFLKGKIIKGNTSYESDCLNHNKNIKCEIYVSKKPIPITNFKSITNKNSPSNKEKLLTLSSFRKEEDYLNPIKLWYNFDTDNSIKNKKDEENTCLISIDKSINNNQINIINQKLEEPKLDLIINEIIKLSNNQNILAEKIINLDKNTKKQITYFEERLNKIENKDFTNELINQRVRILYPSNNANKKITEFLTSNNNDKSIYFLKLITQNEIELIDNNFIDDIFDKLIFFLENKIYIDETINFLKKLFAKNKKRFKIDSYKKLLSAFDIILKSGIKFNEQTSFDISWIISSINIEKI